MTTYLAEFPTEAALVAGLKRARRDGHATLDAFTPYPVEALAGAFPDPSLSIRPAMLGAGIVVAALAYAVQAWSSGFGYPLNAGGRPLQSWPVFLLVPFEVGVLAAGIAGFVAFLRATGLPRPYDPLFEVPGIERASQDRFFLLASERQGGSLRAAMHQSGAVVVSEVRS